jgi:hypothetical protein
MLMVCGDAHIPIGDPGRVEIWVDHHRLEIVTVDPWPEGMSWCVYTELVCRPALREHGWYLVNWHRPRADPNILAAAFVWRAPG